jgi:hypothetical protein
LRDIVDAPAHVILAVERDAVLDQDERLLAAADELSAHRGQRLRRIASVDKFDETRIAAAAAQNLGLEHAGRIEYWRLVGADEARVAGHAKARAMEKFFSVRFDQSHEAIPDNLDDGVVALTLEF